MKLKSPKKINRNLLIYMKKIVWNEIETWNKILEQKCYVYPIKFFEISCLPLMTHFSHLVIPNNIY